LLAYGMNGGELPTPHGAPVRLRVTRQLGYKSLKYLSQIMVVDSLKGIRSGLGSISPELGYSWYAGIKADLKVGLYDRESSARRGDISARRSEEEGQAEQRVDADQHGALEPGRFAIQRNRIDDERGGGNRHQLQRITEDEVHRMAERIGDEHQRGRRHQRDLDARADADRHDEPHPIAAREVQRGGVLRGVSHQRQHDHADEEQREAEPLGRWLERARDVLRLDGARYLRRAE